MTVRFYLIPIERNETANARGPKYFTWRYDPDAPALVAGAPWSLKDYGVIDWGIVCADVTAPQHTALAGQTDVGVVPVNLDANPNAAAVTNVQTRLDAMLLPSGWVNTSLSWREIVRTVTGVMLYMQRVTAIRGINPFDNGLNLSITYASLPLAWRTAMQQAADDLLLDYSQLSGGSTLGQILKEFADQMAGRPVMFGSLATI